MRYRELVGKPVVDREGDRIGRVRDLIAERRGDSLRVTALVVGDWGLLERIGLARDRCDRIPWTEVARIDECVQLGRTNEELGVPEEDE